MEKCLFIWLCTTTAIGGHFLTKVITLDGSTTKTKSPYYRQVMTNMEDMQYSVEFSVGGKSLQGIMDTGSFEVLVFSNRCHDDECRGSNSQNFYDSRISHTYHATDLYTAHAFGSGEAYSQMGTDRMSFGDLTIQDQYFWEVLRMDMPVVAEGSFQAVVGIGPPLTPDLQASEASRILKRQAGIASKTPRIPQKMRRAISGNAVEAYELAKELSERPTILENLDTTIFSICLQRAKGSDGYMIWNDDDPLLHEQFSKIEMSGSITWGVNLTNPQLNDAALGCKNGCGAIIDSGTSLLVVPKSVADAVSLALQEFEDPCGNVDQLPDLVFNLGGVRHVLPAHSYVAEVEGEAPAWMRPFLPSPMVMTCSLLFMVEDVMTTSGPLWIVGMPFFREYYTTFDLGSTPYAGPEERAIYTAPVSDESCSHPGSASLVEAQSHLHAASKAQEPQSKSSTTSEQGRSQRPSSSSAKRLHRTARRVNLSKVQVSRKIFQALTTKVMHL